MVLIEIQVAPLCHWPELEVLILVVCAEKKPVSSTAGMQTTVNTSSLIQHRADSVVPVRMREMEEAISKNDFQTFGSLTMKVCLSARSTCNYCDYSCRYTYHSLRFRSCKCTLVKHNAYSCRHAYCN